MKKFNIQEVEKWLKRCLKEKVSINEATVVRYCMLGIIGAFLTISSSLYAGTNLGGAGNLAIYKSGTETREGEDITPKDGYRNPLKLSFGAGLKARKVADEDGNNERVLVTTGGGPEETGLFEYALKDANGELMPLVKIGDKFYSAEAVEGKYYDETQPDGEKFRDLKTGEILEAKDQPQEVDESVQGLGNDTRIVLREKGYKGEPREIYNVAHGINKKVEEVSDDEGGVSLAKNLITNAKEEVNKPKGLIYLKENELNKVATLGDLRAAAIAGLTFIDNDEGSIHRTLGTDLHIIGEGKLDENATDVIEKYKPYSGENIVTQKDPTAGNHKLLIKLSKTPRFDGVTLSKKDDIEEEGRGENPVSLKNDNNTPNTLILSGVEIGDGVGDPAVDEANRKYAAVKISNVAPGVAPKDAVNKSQLDSATPFEYIEKTENGEPEKKLVRYGNDFYRVSELEGKYYDEDEGKFIDYETGTETDNPPTPVEKENVLISSKIKNEPLLEIVNIASGIDKGEIGTNKIDVDKATKLIAGDTRNGKGGLYAIEGENLNKVATVGDLQALGTAGLEFGGNQGEPAHRKLGTKLDIVGKVGNVDDFDTAYSVDNVATKVETAADGLATLSIGISKNPRFDTIELGAKAKDPDQDKKIVLTPDAENSTLTLSKNDADNTDQPVKLTGLKDAELTDDSKDAVTGKQLKDVGDKLGLTLNGEKNGFDAPEFTKLLDVDGTEITPTGNPNFLSVLNSTISKVNDGITFGATLGDNTADPKKKQQLGSTLEVKEGDITDNGIEYKSTNLKTKYKNENGNGLITIGLKDEVEFKSITLKNGKDKKAGTMTVSDEGNVIFNNPIYVGNKIEDDNSNKVVTFADLKPTTDSEKTRYVSIKKDDTDKVTAGSNYNNDGAAGKSSIAIGRFAKATEDYSVAVGSASEASAKDALVFGNYSKAEAAGAVTLGNTSNAKKEDSVALGSRSLADREKGEIGYNFDGHKDDAGILGNSKAKYDELTAEITTLDKEIEKEREKYDAAGEDEKPEIDKEIDKKIKIRNKKLADKNKLISTWKSTLGAVAVGNSETGDTRQITGVAAGTEDTDAVNLAQLKSLADKSIFFKAQFDEAAISERKNSENKTFSIVATKDSINKDGANFVGGNLITKLETTTEGATISIGLKETPRFNSIELGAKPTDVNATDNKIVLTPDAENSKLTLSKNGGDDPVKLTGLKDADLTANSTDAVTGKQLHTLGNNSLTFKDGGTGAGYTRANNVDGTVTITEADFDAYKGSNLKVKLDNQTFKIGMTETPTFTSVSIGNNGPVLSATGLDIKNQKISNLAEGTDPTDAVNKAQLDKNKVTVTVNENENGKTGPLELTTTNVGDNGKDGKNYNIKLNIDDSTLEITQDGKLKAKPSNSVEKGTIELDNTQGNEGKVKIKDGDTGKVATVDTVVSAINEASHKVSTEQLNTEITSNPNTTGVAVKNGDKVTFKAAKNLVIKQDDKDITYGLSKTLEGLTSVAGGDNNKSKVEFTDEALKLTNNDKSISITKDGDGISLTGLTDRTVSNNSDNYGKDLTANNPAGANNKLRAATEGAVRELADNVLTFTDGNNNEFTRANSEGDKKVSIVSGDNITVALTKENTDKTGKFTIGLNSNLTGINSITAGNDTDKKAKISLGDDTITLSKDTDPVKLTGLKDAELTEDSKDAVTGKQLKKLGTTLGLEPENNDNTTFKAPEFTKLLEVDGNPANPANPNFLSVLNSTITKVNDGITFGATLGDNTAEAKKKQQLGSTLEVKEGDITDNGTEYKSTNLKTKYKNENGNGLISIGLKDKVEFAELKIVDGTVTGPIINKDGINAGNKKITNVETGTEGKDAVNVDQLKAAIADLGPKTKVSANGGQEAGNTNGNIKLGITGDPADPKNPLTYDVALNPILTGITSLENGATNGTGGAKITLGSNDQDIDFNGGNLTNVASGIDKDKIGATKITDDKIEEITKLIAGEDKDGKGGLYAIDGENLKKVATVGDLQALAKAGLIFAANKGDEVHRVLGTKLSILGDTEKFDKLKDNTKELEKYLAGFSSKNVITVSDKDSNSINIKIADTPEFKGITLEGPNGANKKPEATIELGTANGTSTLFNPSKKEGTEVQNGEKVKVDERIVYTPKDADGNPIEKDGQPIVREVATMDDGMIFEGDNGATKKKLNDTVKIVGGIVNKSKLSNDDNVGVILDDEENLVIKLAKEMTGITSIGGGRDDANDKDDNSTITFGKDDISLATNGATLKVEKDSKAADGTSTPSDTDPKTVKITGLTDRTANTTAGYGEAGRAATEAAVKELADQLGLGKDKDSVSKTEAGKADKQNDNKTVAERVTALRDGTSGPIVYTDADGNRVVVGEDGKYYKPTDIADKKYVEGKGYFNKDDVTEKPDGTYALKQGVNEDTKVEEASGIKHSLVNATNGSTINSPSVLSNVAEGKSDTDAVNVKQLKDSIKESTYSFSISANKNDTEADKDKIGKDENVLFKADNNLNVSYDKDKNIMTYGLNNTITLGEKAEEGTNGTDRKEGIDGSIGVNGKDGSAVTINGANGSISLNGKDGANALTIKSENGKAGVNETTEKTRIVYERPNPNPNPDGTNTPIKEEVATLNDGMKFAGDTGDVIKKKLNETVNIVGGVTEEAKLTDSNIGVVSDGKGNLTIKLAKNVTGLDSVETKKITVIDEVGNTTVINGDKITITPKDGKEVSLSASGLDNGGNQISNVAAGTEGHHAVNVAQLNEVSNAIINYTDQKINKLDDRMKRGLAGSAAMAGLEFMEIGINQSTVAAAVGGYKGAQAVAVGIQGAPTENTRVNAKFSITPGRTVESMYSVGAAYRFNWK